MSYTWQKKQHNIGCPTFKLPASTKCVMTDPINITTDDFGIWLLGYRV